MPPASRGIARGRRVCSRPAPDAPCVMLGRASARETAARTAAGALSGCRLREFGIEAFGFVRSILDGATAAAPTEENWRELRALRDASETYCPDEAATARHREIIRQA